MGSLREPSHPPQDPPQRRQKMVVSKRYTNAKSGKYSSKITKRNESKEAKKYPFTVGPIVLAFFLFVVLGSYAPGGLPPRKSKERADEGVGPEPQGYSSDRAPFGEHRVDA